MDFGTIIGLTAGVAMLVAAIATASPLGAFIDFPSAIIVVGGAICAAMISFPVQNILAVAQVTKKAFFSKPRDPRTLIADMVGYAEAARRNGILALENLTGQIDDPFIVRGIQMAVDGADPDLIETILTSELEAVEARHAEGKALFDNIGKFAPAFGLIGTLVGLVIMLKNMADPSSIGPAMAIALLTTLYGAVLSNVFALPLAEKLGRRSREEVLLKMIVVKGVMAIQSGDNPRIVEQKLRTFLPAGARRTAVSGKRAA
ncbi:MAG: MotA/TolQ/ExbB proton channel family protein [Planctomycetota bacterium]|jgi:chemotaxis protein MotA